MWGWGARLAGAQVHDLLGARTSGLHTALRRVRTAVEPVDPLLTGTGSVLVDPDGAVLPGLHPVRLRQEDLGRLREMTSALEHAVPPDHDDLRTALTAAALTYERGMVQGVRHQPGTVEDALELVCMALGLTGHDPEREHLTAELAAAPVRTPDPDQPLVTERTVPADLVEQVRQVHGSIRTAWWARA